MSTTVDLVVFGLGAPSKFSPSVLGSGVGGHAARIALEQGLSVRAVARNPDKYRSLYPEALELVQGDVTDRASVAKCLEQAKACVFAVQAADGTSAFEVDHLALVQVAEECVRLNIKLVVISSVYVSPKHWLNPVRAALNRMVKWGMMDAKWEGEQAVRKMAGLRYTIIRPGTLNDKGPLPNEYKVGQGDGLLFPALPIPKVDVGRIAVAAAVDPASDCLTLEVAGSSSKRPATVQNLFNGLKRGA
ncbi:hypothetical protein BASA81_000523 [Batrachochytrium salamandrivorans]|nr:hypothetical protein BASA81_000523 [Batrachochytrium salamandrivorans]